MMWLLSGRRYPDVRCMDLSAASVEELNAELIQRTGSPESLDRLYTLPEWLEDDTLREMYEVLVARLRREIAHVPLSTVQNLLVERLVANYCILRYRENRTLGDAQGFQHAGVEKEFNTYWLAINKQFEDLLIKFKPDDKKALLDHIKDVLIPAFSNITDSQERVAVISAVARGLEGLETL
jgi:hypothetical protein